MNLFRFKKSKQKKIHPSVLDRINKKQKPSAHELRVLLKNSTQSGPVTIDGNSLEKIITWLLFYETLVNEKEKIDLGKIWALLNPTEEESKKPKITEETIIEISSATSEELDQIQQALGSTVVPKEFTSSFTQIIMPNDAKNLPDV